MNKELEDLLRVLSINDGVDKMYKRLADLEINNDTNEDDYNYLISIIRDCRRKADKLMSKYPLEDEYMENYITTIQGLNRIDDDHLYDFYDNPDNIKIKRFLEHYFELVFENPTYRDEELIPEGFAVSINGVDYSLNDAIATLSNLDDEEVLNKVNNGVQEIMNSERERLLEEDHFLLIRSRLEASVTYDYLIELIDKEDNKFIKDELIKFKYKLIGIIRCLEDSYLKNRFNVSMTSYYQQLMEEYYLTDPELFVKINDYYTNIVDELLALIVARKKKNYDNDIDKFYDILLSLKLKVYSSLISIRKIQKKVNSSKKEAHNKAKTKLDKKLINSTIKLNCDLSLAHKIKKLKKRL